MPDAGDFLAKTKQDQNLPSGTALAPLRATAPRNRRPPPEMLQLPKNWFTLELYKVMRKAVRGRLRRTRRKMVTLKRKVPWETFVELMSSMREGDAEGFELEINGEPTPTRTTSTHFRYEYELRKPMAADRLFSLEKADLRGVYAEEGKGTWRRGQGCAVLKLSDAAKKTAKASVMTMVGGNCTIKLIRPKNWASWPMLTLKFWVITIDYEGNMLFPTAWSPISQRLLKELARRKVDMFLQAQHLFPIRPDFCTTPGVSARVLTDLDNDQLLPSPSVPLLM